MNILTHNTYNAYTHISIHTHACTGSHWVWWQTSRALIAYRISFITVSHAIRMGIHINITIGVSLFPYFTKNWGHSSSGYRTLIKAEVRFGNVIAAWCPHPPLSTAGSSALSGVVAKIFWPASGGARLGQYTWSWLNLRHERCYFCSTLPDQTSSISWSPEEICWQETMLVTGWYYLTVWKSRLIKLSFVKCHSLINCARLPTITVQVLLLLLLTAVSAIVAARWQPSLLTRFYHPCCSCFKLHASAVDAVHLSQYYNNPVFCWPTSSESLPNKFHELLMSIMCWLWFTRTGFIELSR